MCKGEPYPVCTCTLARPHRVSYRGVFGVWSQCWGHSYSVTHKGAFTLGEPQRSLQVVGLVLGLDLRPQACILGLWLALGHSSRDQGYYLGVSHVPQRHRLLSALPARACYGPRMSQAGLWPLRLSSPLPKDTDTGIGGHGSHPALLSLTAVPA